MGAPQNPPMVRTTRFLRVFSIKRLGERQETDSPIPETWEVRAETDSLRWMSIFYTESNSRNLPPIGSLIRVVVDDRLVESASGTDAPYNSKLTE